MEWRHLIAEMWGSFMIVFAYTTTGGDPAATAAALMVAHSGTGLISGCHFNPAVTLAYFITGAVGKTLDKATTIKFILYMLMHFLGGLCGAATAWGCTDKTVVLVVGDESSTFQAFLAEGLFTMILVSMILTMNEIPHSHLLGIMVPVLLTYVGLFSLAPISGGAMSPSLAISALGVDAIQREGADEMDDVWIYFAGPLAGGLLGAGAFLGMKPGINEAWPRADAAEEKRN